MPWERLGNWLCLSLFWKYSSWAEDAAAGRHGVLGEAHRLPECLWHPRVPGAPGLVPSSSSPLCFLVGTFPITNALARHPALRATQAAREMVPIWDENTRIAPILQGINGGLVEAHKEKKNQDFNTEYISGYWDFFSNPHKFC